MDERSAFEVSFKSELFHVKQVLKDVMSYLKKRLPDLSEGDITDLRLIYSELLYNAVIHGNKQNTNKRVKLYIKILDGTIFSSITDEGSGFDHLKLLNEMDGHKNHFEDLMREDGRGIRLVYSLADGVFFNVRGNEIKFYKRMSSHV